MVLNAEDAAGALRRWELAAFARTQERHKQAAREMSATPGPAAVLEPAQQTTAPSVPFVESVLDRINDGSSHVADRPPRV